MKCEKRASRVATHTLVENYGETLVKRCIARTIWVDETIDNIQNIHLIGAIMYSKELTLAGQTIVSEYRDKLSVIDLKRTKKVKIG